MVELLHNLLFDYTLRTVALGAAVLGVSSGILGAFAVLRGQSLLGDALSHAALPGVALTFLWGGTKAPLFLAMGAAISGWLGILWIQSVTRYTRVKFDTALAIVLSVFFGGGMVVLTFIQRLPTASKAGLDQFLFGQAAGMIMSDVAVMATLGGAAVALVLVLWKEFKLLCFDASFGRSIGLPMVRLDLLLTTLLVVAIVIGLKTVGVILMSALIVAPGAAARQWTDRLGVMVALSAGFAVVAGVIGAALSSTAARLPTGPMIVVCLSTIVLVSLFLAPRRGIAWRWLRAQHAGRRLRMERVFADLYELSRQHEDPTHAHDLATLRAMQAHPAGVLDNLRKLEEQGWAHEVEPQRWALTDRGLKHAHELERGNRVANLGKET